MEFFEKEGKKAKKETGILKWHWRYLEAAVLFLLNIDLLVAVLTLLDISRGWPLFFMLAPISTVEIFRWYSFWHWFRKEKAREVAEAIKRKIEENEHIREAILLGKASQDALRASGHWHLIFALWKEFLQATDENNKTVKWVKGYGHWAVALLGAEPLPSGRAISFVICGITGWRSGIYTLAAANLVHIATVVWFWNYVRPYTQQIGLATLLVVILLLLLFIFKYLKTKKDKSGPD